MQAGVTHHTRSAQLRKLREIMEQVYALFDLGESLKNLFSPTLEKALVFLDDKLLLSTSNAGERGNRHYRKM